MYINGNTVNKTISIKLHNNKIYSTGDSRVFLGYKIPSKENLQPDGVWVEWDCDQTQFTLTNDWFGFYPVYYFKTENVLRLSTSIIDLLSYEDEIQLDDAAISVFLRLGFYIGNDTPFKNIYALSPNSKIQIRDNKITIKSNHKDSLIPKSNLTQQNAIKEYGSLFQSSIKKYIPRNNEKTCLPLSGGRDSRHILFGLIKNNYKPNSCITIGLHTPWSQDDVITATELSRYFDIPHVILKRPTNQIRSEITKNYITSFCTDEHSWLLPLVNYLKINKFDILYDGIGGDVLSAGLFLKKKFLFLYDTGNFEQLANEILGDEGYLPKMIHPKYYRKWNRQIAIECLKKELIKYENRFNPIGQFFFWNRTRREISLSPFRMLNNDCRVISPFLDLEIYNFLASLPSSHFLDQSFHTQSIVNYYPEYAHFPFEKKHNHDQLDERKEIIKMCSEFIKYSMRSERFEQYINFYSFMLPRLIKGIIDRKYGTYLFKDFLNKSIYLMQLSHLLYKISANRMR